MEQHFAFLLILYEPFCRITEINDYENNEYSDGDIIKEIFLLDENIENSYESIKKNVAINFLILFSNKIVIIQSFYLL